MVNLKSDIRDLAVIGDRRTTALISRDGPVVWYCRGRFDHSSLFAALLDPEKVGAWALDLPDAKQVSRKYTEDSAVLETEFQLENGHLKVTDWMPMGD